MSTQKRRQHYIARTYLRGFLDPELEAKRQHLLWVYEKGAEPRARPPVKVAAEDFFYDIPVDEPGVPAEAARPGWVEDSLQPFEFSAARTLNKLRAGQFPLSSEEKADFSGFIALSHCRTPLYRLAANNAAIKFLHDNFTTLVNDPVRLEEHLRAVEQKSGKRFDTTAAHDAYRAAVDGNVIMEQTSRGWSIKMMFQNMSGYMDLFNSLRWVLLTAPPGDFFIVGDHPVHVQDPGAGGSPMQWSTAVQFAFPISRTQALFGSVSPNEPDHTGTIWPESLDEMNALQAMRALKYVFAPMRSTELQEFIDSHHTQRASPFQM